MLAVLPGKPAASSESATPRLGELPEPVAGPGEVLVAVEATALNRADLLQVRGLYPPPAGESDIPGLECAGRILALGDGAAGWEIGQRVMALLAGGGQGQRVAVPTGQLMPLPEELSFTEGAAIPEAGLTAWTNLVAEGALQEGQTVLITGAASGVGTFAVQLAKALGGRVLAAGRSRERLERLRELGAEGTCLLGEGFSEEVRQLTAGRGVDLVLDLVGGEHLPRCLETLVPQGRLVLVGILAGREAKVPLWEVLRRRLRIQGSVLRGRSRAEKAKLVSAFSDFALPRLASGELRPVIDRVMPFADIAEAYRVLEASRALGKVVLEMPGG